MTDNEKFKKEKEQEIFRHFRLGEHLLQSKKISIAQLDEAIQEQQESGNLIGKILVEKGFITQEELQTGLNQQFNADSIVDDIKEEVKDKIDFKIVD